MDNVLSCWLPRQLFSSYGTAWLITVLVVLLQSCLCGFDETENERAKNPTDVGCAVDFLWPGLVYGVLLTAAYYVVSYGAVAIISTTQIGFGNNYVPMVVLSTALVAAPLTRAVLLRLRAKSLSELQYFLLSVVAGFLATQTDIGMLFPLLLVSYGIVMTELARFSCGYRKEPTED